MSHLTFAEPALMERLEKQDCEPGYIIKTVGAARRRAKRAPASSSAIYKYIFCYIYIYVNISICMYVYIHISRHLAGETCDRNTEESRGQRSSLSTKGLTVYDQVRRRLRTEVGNGWTATCEDMAHEGQKELRKQRLIKRSAGELSAEALREILCEEFGVGRRPAPQHVTWTGGDDARRCCQGRAWVKT